jgi:hypothetical protein
MNKIVSTVVAGAITCGTVNVSLAFGTELKYVQSGCEIDDAHYAVIWMNEQSQVGKESARAYSLQFDPSGLVVRLPPFYYAPDWEGTAVIVDYQSTDANAAILRLQVQSAFGIKSTQTIGLVQRDCWEKVKSYFQRNIVSKGIRVNLVEVVPKPE